jgi:hypothetical protein
MQWSLWEIEVTLGSSSGKPATLGLGDADEP